MRCTLALASRAESDEGTKVQWGPTKGDAVYSIMGSPRSFPLNRSPTVPPAIDMKALPQIPLMKRPTSKAWIVCATAHGISQMTTAA